MAADGAPTSPPGPWQSTRASLRQNLRSLLVPQVSTAARERRDTIVLLIAVALVVAPHFDHIPWWSVALLALLWLWRLELTVSRRPLPGRFAMLPLLIGAAGAVALEHGTLVGRDAGVNFLLLLMALKILEMRARRDVFVVIFLAFFILLTQFMFGQGLHIAALTLAAVILLFFVLVSVNLVEADLPAVHKFRLTGRVLLQAIPLTIVLFVLFPRLSGPLWSLGSDPRGASTGLSERMTPGSIGSLLQSDEIAFRVRFDGPHPARSEMYWRGPVFGTFTGRSWIPMAQRLIPPAAPTVDADPASGFDYTVTLEPHHRDWLFALELPAGADSVSPLAARMNADGELLLAGGLVNERTRYSARSYARYAIGRDESPLALQDWVALPPGFNARTLQFAADLRRSFTPLGTEGRSADARLVEAVLDLFRRNEFYYTLEPPLLGKDSVDEFLFETRRGYCEHYASAFVVLMRALDIPARVITGYQGGDLNPVDGFLTVRQSDAHAWAEVWLPGRGWARVDPTAAVDPSRVDQGARAASRVTNPAGAALGTLGIGWLQRARFNWEAMQNAWNQWVLSYTPERQRALLKRLGVNPSVEAVAVTFAIALTLVLLALGALSLRHTMRRDPLAELTDRFRSRLEQAGIDVPPHEGLSALQCRLQRELAPSGIDAASEILQALDRWRYSRASQWPDRRELRRLRRAVSRFRPLAAVSAQGRPEMLFPAVRRKVR
jgi:transglutaminase-like putative cysteine protease